MEKGQNNESKDAIDAIITTATQTGNLERPTTINFLTAAHNATDSRQLNLFAHAAVASVHKDLDRAYSELITSYKLSIGDGDQRCKGLEDRFHRLREFLDKIQDQNLSLKDLINEQYRAIGSINTRDKTRARTLQNIENEVAVLKEDGEKQSAEVAVLAVGSLGQASLAYKVVELEKTLKEAHKESERRLQSQQDEIVVLRDHILDLHSKYTELANRVGV
jgi:chromosome segregation ATPase